MKTANNIFVVAEVAQAHEGSLGMAHAFIDAVADTGADAIKFQTHIAEAESTPEEPWRIRFSLQDPTRYHYWKRMEFNEDQWQGLADHARRRNLEFIASPFSFEAVELLEKLQIQIWKVSSGEVSNLPLLERIARTKKPIILSSGLSDWKELDSAVALIKNFGNKLCVLQCTTEYPTPPERIGLNVLAEIRSRYNCAVGLSDHSGTIFPSLAAAALGANVVEVHVTFSKKAFGPDVVASVTIEELTNLVQGIRFIGAALANPVDKEKTAPEQERLRTIFGRSIVAVRPLEVGTILGDSDVTLKKPGGGLGPEEWYRVLGRKLRRAVKKDERLTWDDLE